jgi:hypothetical protein
MRFYSIAREKEQPARRIYSDARRDEKKPLGFVSWGAI